MINKSYIFCLSVCFRLYLGHCNRKDIKAEGCSGARLRQTAAPSPSQFLAMRSISVIALLIAPFAVSATRVSWNPVYDQGAESLSNVACSNGPNGLLSKGYNEFSDLPTFPNITGSSVATWDSPYCGSFRFTPFGFAVDVWGSLRDRHLLESHLYE